MSYEDDFSGVDSSPITILVGHDNLVAFDSEKSVTVPCLCYVMSCVTWGPKQRAHCADQDRETMISETSLASLSGHDVPFWFEASSCFEVSSPPDISTLKLTIDTSSGRLACELSEPEQVAELLGSESTPTSRLTTHVPAYSAAWTVQRHSAEPRAMVLDHAGRHLHLPSTSQLHHHYRMGAV